MTAEPVSQQAVKGTILCVDDDKDVLIMMDAVFSTHGYDTVVAHDGQEGVDVFRQHKAELVAAVLDIRMPLKDGFEAAREIRTESADIPLIAVSAYFGGTQKDGVPIKKVTEAGFNAYSTKPFVIDRLLKTVDELVQQYKAKRNS
ncbi:MAG: hypothetical protein C0404_01615 [Verrucomicrobia bacterium]|nr:hypothetical protein [Verrucomicrobiota bacterium]